MSESFPKRLRIRRRPLFLRVQRSRTRLTSEDLVLTYRLRPRGLPRVGFTVSKKVGNAVVRNRVKRRLREIVRRSWDRFPPAVDAVWIARPTAADASYASLAEQVHRGLLAITTPGRR